MMKQKVSALLLLTAILSIVMVSAADFTFTQSTQSKAYTTTIVEGVFPTYNLSGTYTTIKYDDGTTNIPITGTSNTTDKTITLSSSAIDFSKLTLGKTYTGTITIANSTAPLANETKTVEIIKTFCTSQANNTNQLAISTLDITNNGEGSSDTDWLPLDDIEIKVKFENNRADNDSNKLSNVYVELGIIDTTTGKNIAGDMIWTSTGSEKKKLGSLNGGDDATHIFEFKVPADADEGNYVVMVKAYPKSDEETTCIDYSETNTYTTSIQISKETDDARIITFDIPAQETVTCDKSIDLNLKGYNIGSDDQDAAKVILYNKALGIINQNYVLKNFNAGDTKTVPFTFTIPKGTKEGVYTLDLYTEYDYDKDDDKSNDNEINYDDDSFSTTTDVQDIKLKVEGNCKIEVANSKITAALDAETPEPTAGKQVVVKTTVTNNGDKETTYVVSAEGYKDWATLASISSQSFTLAPGESKNIDVSLNVNSNAEGDKEFTIKTSYENGQTTSQKVALTVAKPAVQTGIISSVTEHVKSNSFLYIIAAINLILIIAIISIVKKSLAGAAASRMSSSDDF